MLLERQDGTPIQPGESVAPQSVPLPKLGKRQSVFAYYDRLSMEQAIALAVVSKVTRTTPEGFIKTRLARNGITVYPEGNAPSPNAPPPVGPEHPVPYAMAESARAVAPDGVTAGPAVHGGLLIDRTGGTEDDAPISIGSGSRI